MDFYRCTVRDWFRHVKAELFFEGLPSAAHLCDALAAHKVCRDLEGRQALRTRYKPILRDPCVDPRGPPWRRTGSSVEIVLERVSLG